MNSMNKFVFRAKRNSLFSEAWKNGRLGLDLSPLDLCHVQSWWSARQFIINRESVNRQRLADAEIVVSVAVINTAVFYMLLVAATILTSAVLNDWSSLIPALFAIGDLVMLTTAITFVLSWASVANGKDKAHRRFLISSSVLYACFFVSGSHASVSRLAVISVR